MFACPIRHRRLKNLRHICVDEAATDPLSRKCMAGRPRLHEGLNLLAITAPNVGLLDIGAHIGFISLVFAAAGRAVHAIEANPRNHALLSDSAKLNGFSHLIATNVAVSDKPGVLSFMSAGAFSHVVNAHMPQQNNTINVACVDLDSWPEASGIPERIIVKMDIEGHEPQALRGMSRFLRDRRLPPIFIESNAHCLHWSDATPESLAKSLEDLGYELFLCRRARLLLWRDRFRLLPWDSSQHQGRTLENVLCVQRGDERVNLPVPAARLSESDFASEFLHHVRKRGVDQRRSASRLLLRLSPEQLRDVRIVKAIAILSTAADPEIVEALRLLRMR